MTPEEWADQFAEDWGMTMETMRDLEERFRAAVEAEREACAQVCAAIAEDQHDQYKGRGAHAPNNPGRADPHVEGQSDGAWLCESAIRARST